ncbi:MAG: rhodanese-like domain-containing protein [Bacillota bacterium]|nr:rhodanese-like domain-containing protein [Bacillota bacterium]
MARKRALLPINEVNRIAAGREGSLIIDVRTEAEYESGHLPGARLHPHQRIALTLTEEAPDLGTPLILYSRTGRRSSKACQLLRQLGYTDVSDAGGIVDYTGILEFGRARG